MRKRLANLAIDRICWRRRLMPRSRPRSRMGSLGATPAGAHPKAETEALDLAMKAIALQIGARARQHDTASRGALPGRPWSAAASPTRT